MLNELHGTILRRVLINYRVEPDALDDLLPDVFAPQLVDGFAIAGICLIELSLDIPATAGRATLRSTNGAHRVAVTAPNGQPAVYIPHRHSTSRLVCLAGGRVFPGRHDHAEVSILELRTNDWAVAPLATDAVYSRLFDDTLPAGSATFDHALMMHNIDHTWQRHRAIKFAAA